MIRDCQDNRGDTIRAAVGFMIFTHLHPFHGEERGQIGGERGQHEHDEHPVRGDQNTSADGFRSLATSLRGERRQREPETLDQRKVPARLNGQLLKFYDNPYFSCTLLTAVT